MNNVRVIGTYALLFIALLGCFGLIFYGRGDEDQAWPVILLVIGALVRDAVRRGGESAHPPPALLGQRG